MIRHALVEGWQLLRERALVSAALALALTVPLALAGLTLTAGLWLRPLLPGATAGATVAILLHPVAEPAAVPEWVARVRAAHPEWSVEAVSADELAQRLRRWFPYLTGLLDNDTVGLLPPLVEVTVPDPAAVLRLAADPAVLAVGPRASWHTALRRSAVRFGGLLLALSGLLLGGAMLLAAVWVHLELYRHSDELTIMRLVGATEWTVRGPFLLGVAVPAFAAGILSGLVSLLLVRALSGAVSELGLPALEIAPWVLAVQLAAALVLPLLAAWLTLARHATLADDVSAL